MAIDTDTIDGLPDFTDAQLLKATRRAIAAITLTGTSRGINGRTLTTANLPDLWTQVRELELRIGSDSNDGNVLVQFGETQ